MTLPWRSWHERCLMIMKWQVGLFWAVLIPLFLFLSIISLLFHLFSSSSILFKIFWVCCYISTEMVPRSGSADGGSTVIKLDTVRRIAEKVSSNIKVMFTVLFSVSVWYFLFDFFFSLSLPRISTLCWISLPLQWKGSTTSSTTRWFCS